MMLNKWHTPATVESVIEYLVEATGLEREKIEEIVKRNGIGIDVTWHTGDLIADKENLIYKKEHEDLGVW